MNRLILALSTILFLAACNNSPSAKDLNVAPEEPDVINIAPDDADMNKAIRNANTHFYRFREALADTNNNYSDFAIKMRFQIGQESGEHIWLNNIIQKDSVYYGIVSNVPVNITTVKYGDRVKIIKEDISDWSFMDGDTLRGGYTIKALRSRMNKNEKDEFDRDYGIIFEP